MAILPCPSCGMKIKVLDDAEGKKVRCPGCEKVLAVSEDGLELASRTGVKASGPSRERGDEDDRDDRPKRSRRDDDDDDEPRRRRSRDDDRRRPRPKKSQGGMPWWVWLIIGGGSAAVVVVLLVIFLGGGSKFSKVKEGMSKKEVIEILGEPTVEVFDHAVWYYPPLSPSDLNNMNMEKLSKVKEVLEVDFENDKVKRTTIHKAGDFQRPPL